MILKHWLRGVRLYIAGATVLIAAEVWWWAAVTYGGSNLTVIRAQEVYAWLALFCLLLAVLIGPVMKVFPQLPGKAYFRDARRMIGIAAAIYATLHAGISYIVLFKAPNPLTLAGTYQRSFLIGGAGLLVLLVMAFTSFDAAFRSLDAWWFRLHRLVYLAMLGALLHAFMVGTHATNALSLWLVGLAAVLLLGLHTYIILRVREPTNLQIVTITYAVLFTAAVLNYGLTAHLGHNILLPGHSSGHQHG